MSTTAPVENALFCIGVSHHGAPLELLERLSIPVDALGSALEPFAARGPAGDRLCEGVVLSTCNRTEIYAAPRVRAAPDGTPPVFMGLPHAIIELLSQRSGLTAETLAVRLFRHEGWAAADHLFRVVCGLDSLVVGEAQIAGQVARAYAAAQAAGTAGVVLSTLFQGAIRGGRRARARIGVGRSASNVGSIAVRRAEALVGPLAAARVAVIGTGEIGRLVLHGLREHGAHPDIVSHSEERAASAAEHWGGTAHVLSRLGRVLDACDVLISTTRATQPVVTAPLIGEAMTRRAGRQLVLIDIAVPRTIDPKARAIPGVVLLDIDSFREDGVASPGALSADDVIAADLAGLRVLMNELSLRPVIRDMWQRAAAIRGEVLQRTREQLPHMDDQSWRLVEDLATSLVARILHDPAVRLRAEAGNGHAAAYAEALRQLFGTKK